MKTQPMNLTTKNITAEASIEGKTERVMHLTKRGIWDLRDLEVNQTFKDKNIVVQVTTTKMFDQNSKFKAQYTLSDGVAQMQSIVTEGIFNKLVSILYSHLFKYFDNHFNRSMILLPLSLFK